MAPTTENITSSVPVVDLQSAVSDTHSSLIEGQQPAETLTQTEENAASATEVILSSALDTPVNDRPLAEMVLAPEKAVGVEEDMQALLSLLAVEVSVPACLDSQEEGNAPQKESPRPKKNQGPVSEVLASMTCFLTSNGSPTYGILITSMTKKMFCSPFVAFIVGCRGIVVLIFPHTVSATR
ncbi:hypothetical protein [Yersinia bercovieri]|uniref:hypothetical protein n=1 Tax=Yersinia bercovieri TaxID=634 RepID=UPI003B98701B